MIKNLLIFFTLILCAISSLPGQSRQDIEDLFKDGNSYFYFEDYEEALAIYLDIYGHFPENANLDYRIGLCYLNIPGSKQKSIPYLERASKNISKRYNESSTRETRAPIEAIFYLGNAYFSNNQLTKAKESYDLFREQIKSERQYDMVYFNHQVEGLNRSLLIQKYPVNFLRSNLGENINNRFPNFNPVISGDGNTLAYTTKERFYQAIYVSRKEGNKWGRPQNITLDLVVDGNASTLSISYSGDELYLFKDTDHVGNIYVTKFKNDRWSPMQKLNANINTNSYETHASISANGKKLFFASNRPGGYGDLDIYVSERLEDGDWGPAKNLGPNINTRFNENTPFITSNGKTLFFSSEGHNSMGGYDIFFAQLQTDGTWSKPINIGYPINSTDDDLFYHPINDGSMGLMAIFDPKGYGEKDITQIEIFLPRYQRTIVSSSDFAARRTDASFKTLVIDTVNVSGLALLDPTKPENTIYLGSDSRYTLFFEGKPYDVRDQSKIVQAISARLATRQTNELLNIPVRPKTADIIESDEIDEETERLISFVQKTEIDATSELVEKESASIQTLVDASITNQLTTDRNAELLLETARFNSILMQLADKKLKPTLTNAFEMGILTKPNVIPAIQAQQLAHFADSTNTTEDFITLYSKLLDLVSLESIEGQPRMSRKIKQSTLNEDFFFRVQKIKRMASPGLSELLDEAIINQPKIISFKSLWDYFRNEKYDEIKPFLNEFLTLLSETSIEGYNSLSNASKEEIINNLGYKLKPVSGVIAISFISIGLFILIIIVLRRRKRK